MPWPPRAPPSASSRALAASAGSPLGLLASFGCLGVLPLSFRTSLGLLGAAPARPPRGFGFLGQATSRGNLIRLALVLGFLAFLQELSDLREACEIVGVRIRPFLSIGERKTAEEEVRMLTIFQPLAGGRFHVSADDHALAIGVDPVLERRPVLDQRLVNDLDRALLQIVRVVGRYQPVTNEGFDDLRPLG